MEVPFRTINVATVASPMQQINELNIEYDFIGPNYEITSTYFNNIPTFVANCTVIKDCINYTCTSERSTNKKQAKHDAARKLSELLNKDYVFSEQNGLEAIPKSLGGRKILYKYFDRNHMRDTSYRITIFFQETNELILIFPLPRIRSLQFYSITTTIEFRGGGVTYP